MRLINVLAACLLSVACMPSSAWASTIDFRQAVWHGAFGQTVFNHTIPAGNLAGLGLRIEAGPNGARIWQDSADGFGVIFRYENDEIEQDEQLRIHFSEQVVLSSIGLADLFIEGRVEQGRYSVDQGATWVTFNATARGGNGHLSIPLAGLLTDSLWFTGTGQRDGREFAVQQLGLMLPPAPPPVIPPPVIPPPVMPPPAEVPEPATLLLLGSALLGARYRKRKFN